MRKKRVDPCAFEIVGNQALDEDIDVPKSATPCPRLHDTLSDATDELPRQFGRIVQRPRKLTWRSRRERNAVASQLQGFAQHTRVMTKPRSVVAEDDVDASAGAHRDGYSRLTSMTEGASDAPAALRRQRPFRLAVAALLIAGVLIRCSVLLWSDPWGPHHPDEDILPLEAMALWEGITPREVGWPASTTRVLLSGIQAVQWAVARGQSA